MFARDAFASQARRVLTRSMIAFLAAISLLYASHAHAQSKVVAVPPEELIPKHDAAYFVERLQSPDEPIWREAQIGLAMSGPRILDPLAKLLEANADNTELRKRIRDSLTVGMLTTIRWDELKRRPHLAALVHNEVLTGMDIANELVAAAEPEVRRTSVEPVSRRFVVRILDKADGFSTTRLERFKRLSGCAVPALQFLCNHEFAICRGQGLLLIEYLDATVCRPEIDKLKTDQAEVPNLQGPMMAPGVRSTTLAARAGRSESQFKTMWSLAGSIDKHGIALLNLQPGGVVDTFRGVSSAAVGYAMRDVPDDLTSEARWKMQRDIPWDEWWKGARVVWKVYFETHGPTAGWAEKQRWNNWFGRRTRCEFDITGDGVAATKLSVVEPVGGRCKITDGDEVIAEGPIPLETERRAKANDPHGGFKIEAAAPGCRPWKLWMASHNGRTVVVRFYKDFLD